MMDNKVPVFNNKIVYFKASADACNPQEYVIIDSSGYDFKSVENSDSVVVEISDEEKELYIRNRLLDVVKSLEKDVDIKTIEKACYEVVKNYIICSVHDQ